MTAPSDPTALLRKGLSLLIVFDVVADLRSVTAAARHLSLTQSALSHALRRLRELFDDPLFVRGNGGLVLTPRAEQMVQPVRALLCSAEALLHDESSDPGTFDGEVRLGLGEGCLLPLDGPSLVHLHAYAPRLRLRIGTTHGDGERKVQDGIFDIGIWYADQVPTTLHATELFVDRYQGVVHPDHALASDPGPVTLDDYLHHLHVDVELPGMRGNPLKAALDRLGVERETRISTPAFLPTFASLAHSSLIATAPSHLVTTARRMGFDLATFDLPFETGPLPCRMFWSERTARDAASTWLRNMLVEAFEASRATLRS
jgi:DNA-binding transcriptional LysR family regulator